MTYCEFVKNEIFKKNLCEPIYSREVAKKLAIKYDMNEDEAKAATSVAIKRIIDKKMIPELRCYKKGIYFRTTSTPFGDAYINKSTLIYDKYIDGDNGYETGLSLLNRLNLTTQIPSRKELATNYATNGLRKDKELGVYICPPKTKITSHNKKYLQVLDAIDISYKAPCDVDDPNKIYADYIREEYLDYGELLAMASKYYNKHTIMMLARIAEKGIENETT